MLRKLLFLLIFLFYSNQTALPATKNHLTIISNHTPVIVLDVASPEIDESQVVIQSTACNQSTGSITNIHINGGGNYQYNWKNDQGQIVANTLDLLNKPAGKYRLQVSDGTQGGTVNSSVFEIEEINGVNIDDTEMQKKNTTCAGNDGSIKGINVTGATAFKWTDTQNNIISTDLDLIGVGPGTYTFTASGVSCNKSRTYTIDQQPNLIDLSNGNTKILTDATCNLNNGRIEIIWEDPVKLPKSYRWENASGQTVGGNSLILENIDAGTYYLYGTDDNGCEIPLIHYAIRRKPSMQVNTSQLQLLPDKCDMKTGGIKGITVSAGKEPYVFKWINEKGEQVGNQPDLSGMPAGDYQLQITDASACSPFITNYTIISASQSIEQPEVKPLQLCAPGNGLLKVSNALPGSIYRLYDSPASSDVLDSSDNGIFNISVNANRSYYVSRTVGSCESSRTAVEVSVGLSGLIIPNTITPNNDGVNDEWVLNGMENYPDALIQIFNRYGKKVYESHGYTLPFNGNSNGAPLPVGAYYYIIHLGHFCNLLTGCISLVR